MNSETVVDKWVSKLKLINHYTREDYLKEIQSDIQTFIYSKDYSSDSFFDIYHFVSNYKEKMGSFLSSLVMGELLLKAESVGMPYCEELGSLFHRSLNALFANSTNCRLLPVLCKFAVKYYDELPELTLIEFFKKSDWLAKEQFYSTVQFRAGMQKPLIALPVPAGYNPIVDTLGADKQPVLSLNPGLSVLYSRYFDSTKAFDVQKCLLGGESYYDLNRFCQRLIDMKESGADLKARELDILFIAETIIFLSHVISNESESTRRGFIKNGVESLLQIFLGESRRIRYTPRVNMLSMRSGKSASINVIEMARGVSSILDSDATHKKVFAGSPAYHDFTMSLLSSLCLIRAGVLEGKLKIDLNKDAIPKMISVCSEMLLHRKPLQDLPRISSLAIVKFAEGEVLKNILEQHPELRKARLENDLGI